jgi:hypothetical protein
VNQARCLCRPVNIQGEPTARTIAKLPLILPAPAGTNLTENVNVVRVSVVGCQSGDRVPCR